MSNVLGVDVSRWQGVMDWRKAYAAGARFAFARACVGANPDTLFAENAAGASSAGLQFGAYIVIHPSVTAAQHIATLERVAENATLDFPVVLDCEINAAIPQAQYRKLIEDVARGLSGEFIIYTRASWWDVKIGRSSFLETAPLWVAHYGAQKPTLPRGWDEWQCWQWSADGNRRGAEFGAESQDIDLNWMTPEFFGSPPNPPEPPNALEKRVATLEIGLAALTARVVALETAPPQQPPAPPEFDTRIVIADKAVAFAANGVNGAGAPIININAYTATGDTRLKWNGGETLKTKGAAIKADGGQMWYLLHDVPLHDFGALYVKDNAVQ